MLEEKYGTRDRAYSAWHRPKSIMRFLDLEQAKALSMIDVDAAMYVECRDGTFEPLVLIETAIYTGKDDKPTTMLKQLAARCKGTMPAYVVLYTHSSEPNPADKSVLDIEQFRVKRVWPENWPMRETYWETVSPKQWATRLWQARTRSVEELKRGKFFDLHRDRL